MKMSFEATPQLPVDSLENEGVISDGWTSDTQEGAEGGQPTKRIEGFEQDVSGRFQSAIQRALEKLQTPHGTTNEETVETVDNPVNEAKAEESADIESDPKRQLEYLEEMVPSLTRNKVRVGTRGVLEVDQNIVLQHYGSSKELSKDVFLKLYNLTKEYEHRRERLQKKVAALDMTLQDMEVAGAQHTDSYREKTLEHGRVQFDLNQARMEYNGALARLFATIEK